MQERKESQFEAIVVDEICKTSTAGYGAQREEKQQSI